MYEATAQSHFLFISVIIFLLNCICILKAFSLLGNVSLYRLPGSQGIIHSSAISPKYLHSVHTFLMHQFLLQQVPEVAAFTFPKFIFCLTLILNLILKVNNCQHSHIPTEQTEHPTHPPKSYTPIDQRFQLTYLMKAS